MEAFATALEGLALAQWLRYSRWTYAAVSATHLLAISLLLGAVITLDLRLLGLWRSIGIAQLYRVLAPIAATGLLLAVLSGTLLFSVRATEYTLLNLFFFKLGLVATGAAIAAMLHFGLDVERIPPGQQRLIGALSLLIWPAVLVCGRLLAFV